MNAPLNTEELRKQVGVETAPRFYEIEKGLVKRFALAIGDPNPLWQDEEYARKTNYGGIIAPPALVIALGWEDFQTERMSVGAGLHAGTELEYYQPIRVGDTIGITSKLLDMRERESQKLGRMSFLDYERLYRNQNQKLVARCRQLIIVYRPKEQ